MPQTFRPRRRWPCAALLASAVFAVFAVAIPDRSALAASAPGLGDLSAQQPAGTREMIARLDRLWRESDPLKNFYLNTAAIAPSRELWARTPSLPERLQQLSPYRLLLQAGRNDEVERCGRCCAIPAAAEADSLNLAQAVQITVYELRLALAGGSRIEAALQRFGEDPPAEHGALDQRRVEPKVSTSAPITTTRAGLQVRVSLAQ